VIGLHVEQSMAKRQRSGEFIAVKRVEGGCLFYHHSRRRERFEVVGVGVH